MVKTLGDSVAHYAGLIAGVLPVDLLKSEVARAAGDGSCSHCSAAESFLNLLRSVKTCAHILHVLPLAADSACARIAACDSLAEDGEVGFNAEVALSARHADSEAGNNLVKDKQRAVLAAETFNALIEFLGKGSCSALGTDRLNENGSGAAAKLVFAKLPFKVVQIVREKFLSISHETDGNAVSLSKLCSGDTDTVAELIRPAVVCAAHFKDIFFLGGKPCNAAGNHAGLGSRTEHTEHINGWNGVGNLLCKLIFKLMEKSG